MSFQLQELEDKLSPLRQSLEKELLPTREDDQKLVQKGLILFRQHLVSNVKVREDEAIAEVQDVTPVHVRLDFHFPLLSKCSCPQKPWCRHRLATFFMLYNKVGRVNDWVEDWRDGAQQADVSGEPNKQAALQDLIKKHGGLKKASELLQEQQSRGETPEEWWSFFGTVLYEEDYELLERQAYMIDIHIQNFYKRFMRKSPLETEWKPLYQLYASFYLFQEIDAFIHRSERTFRDPHSLYEYLLAEMEFAVKRLSVHALPFRFDPFISFLKDKTEELSLSTEQSTLAKAEVYRYLWYYLFKKKQWRQQEIDRLEGLQSEEDVFHSLALLHQYILIENRSEIEAILKKLGAAIVPYSDFWIEQLFSMKKYDLGTFLLKQLQAKIPQYLQSLREYEASQFSRWFLQTMPLDYMIEHEATMLKELLENMLPYSFYTYNDLLLHSRSFKQWVELQKYMNYSLQEMEGLGLKDIAKESPQYVLPLYHNGIMHYIEQKNRDSYRLAVRYLKRLRTAYKKLKRTEQWDIYFEFILEKTKRLRAFQEECRKGKLLDA